MNANDRLKRVFSQSFDLRPDADFESLRYREVSAWDSVGHMQLVAALETEFDVMLDTDEVIDLSSFPKAREILGKHDVSFES